MWTIRLKCSYLYNLKSFINFQNKHELLQLIASFFHWHTICCRCHIVLLWQVGTLKEPRSIAKKLEKRLNWMVKTKRIICYQRLSICVCLLIIQLVHDVRDLKEECHNKILLYLISKLSRLPVSTHLKDFPPFLWYIIFYFKV